MALYATQTFTANADPFSAVLTHGIGAVPDLVVLEWLQDPGAGAYYFTASKTSTAVTLTVVGANGVSFRVHTWKWHSYEA